MNKALKGRGWGRRRWKGRMETFKILETLETLETFGNTNKCVFCSLMVVCGHICLIKN
jgi:hypothetical protein